MKSNFFCLILLFVIYACEKEHRSDYQSDIKIVYGTACGWCAGMDSIVLTSESANYFYDNPCDNSKDFKNTAKTDSIIWNSLLEKLNWKAFRAINVNSCNVCVDGCDTLLRIQIQDESHFIRFGYSDTAAVHNIRPLIQTLETAKLYYNSNN